jgi:hypothetical protein
MSEGDTLTNALLGAAVTVVATFTGFAPLLGGAVAGYLNRRDGPLVGALSGAIAAVPVLFLAVLLASMLAAVPVVGDMGIGLGMGPGLIGSMGLVALVVAVAFFLVYTVGLGAIGGYLGVSLSEDL